MLCQKLHDRCDLLTGLDAWMGEDPDLEGLDPVGDGVDREVRITFDYITWHEPESTPFPKHGEVNVARVDLHLALPGSDVRALPLAHWRVRGALTANGDPVRRLELARVLHAGW